MDFVNETGLEAAWVVGKINPPAPSLTALIKGTFRLTPGQSARPVDDQMALTGDQFEAEDPQKPLRYPSDFAPFKPRADIMLIGTCHAPGGMPVSARACWLPARPPCKGADRLRRSPMDFYRRCNRACAVHINGVDVGTRVRRARV
jgi:hypothetical protein